ncbi:MAG: PucR family transcriptional regulator ligand-binding domain-containing protein, partial [Eubacteriales bacterium]
MAMTLSKLCKDAEKSYELKLVAGKSGMENPVRWIHIVEDLEVPDFLQGGELVFTTGIASRQANWLLQ